MKNILNIEITRPNQVLIIMRGIPGAGKSTMAESLVEDGIIHSTDNVIEANGDYRLFFFNMFKTKDFSPLNRMHRQNYDNLIESIKQGISPVILDNTNIKKNEAKNYIKTALELGLDDNNIKIIDIGTGGLTAEELARRNTHGVPLDKIKKMIASHRGQGSLTVENILKSKDMYKPSNVLYSCVLLDRASRNKILDVLRDEIPNGWEIICHHMTINLGGLRDKTDLGKTVTLTVTRIGLSDMAMAVSVVGYESANAIPHITVAINPNGGKPVMSNQITSWKYIDPFKVNGIVTEIKV